MSQWKMHVVTRTQDRQICMSACESETYTLDYDIMSVNHSEINNNIYAEFQPP